MASSEGKNIAQVGAFLVGVVYTAIGVIGFVVTGFGEFVQDTPDDLLGFDLNPFHNVVHLAVGAYLLFVSMLSRVASEGALIGGGLVYLVAAILGFNERLPIISISEVHAPDNYLHLASGTAALLIGLIGSLTHPDRRGGAVQQY